MIRTTPKYKKYEVVVDCNYPSANTFRFTPQASNPTAIAIGRDRAGGNILFMVDPRDDSE